MTKWKSALWTLLQGKYFKQKPPPISPPPAPHIRWESKLNTMYLLTESEGQTGLYLALGQDIWIEHSKVHVSCPRDKWLSGKHLFSHPVWPHLVINYMTVLWTSSFVKSKLVTEKVGNWSSYESECLPQMVKFAVKVFTFVSNFCSDKIFPVINLHGF